MQCITEINSIDLWYQVNGQLFGPFSKEQMFTWWSDGQFSASDVYVSTSPAFTDACSIASYFVGSTHSMQPQQYQQYQQQQPNWASDGSSIIEYEQQLNYYDANALTDWKSQGNSMIPYGQKEQPAQRIMGALMGFGNVALGKLAELKEKVQQGTEIVSKVVQERRQKWQSSSHGASEGNPWDEYDQFGNVIPNDETRPNDENSIGLIDDYRPFQYQQQQQFQQHQSLQPSLLAPERDPFHFDDKGFELHSDSIDRPSSDSSESSASTSQDANNIVLSADVQQLNEFEITTGTTVENTEVHATYSNAANIDESGRSSNGSKNDQRAFTFSSSEMRSMKSESMGQSIAAETTLSQHTAPEKPSMQESNLPSSPHVVSGTASASISSSYVRSSAEGAISVKAIGSSMVYREMWNDGIGGHSSRDYENGWSDISPHRSLLKSAGSFMRTTFVKLRSLASRKLAPMQSDWEEDAASGKRGGSNHDPWASEGSEGYSKTVFGAKYLHSVFNVSSLMAVGVVLATALRDVSAAGATALLVLLINRGLSGSTPTSLDHSMTMHGDSAWSSVISSLQLAVHSLVSLLQDPLGILLLCCGISFIALDAAVLPSINPTPSDHANDQSKAAVRVVYAVSMVRVGWLAATAFISSRLFGSPLSASLESGSAIRGLLAVPSILAVCLAVVEMMAIVYSRHGVHLPWSGEANGGSDASSNFHAADDKFRAEYLVELLRNPEIRRWRLQHYVQLFRTSVLKRAVGPSEGRGREQDEGVPDRSSAAAAAAKALIRRMMMTAVIFMVQLIALGNLLSPGLSSEVASSASLCSSLAAMQSSECPTHGGLLNAVICQIKECAGYVCSGESGLHGKLIIVLGAVVAPLLLWLHFLSASQQLVPQAIHAPAAALASTAPRSITMPQVNADVLPWGGWRESQNASLGVQLEGLAVHPSILTNVTLSLPPGGITVVVGSPIDSKSKSALLDTIFGTKPYSGSVLLQGRLRDEWCRDTYQSSILYLRSDEERFLLQAGAVAGCLPGISGEELTRHYKASEATGARHILQRLAHGPATILTPTSLTQAEWNAMAACRALSMCDETKRVVLLDGICDGFSEAEEAKIFSFLRACLDKDPSLVVVMTAARMATARHGDSVVVLSRGKVVDTGSFDAIAAKVASFSAARTSSGTSVAP